MRKTLLVALFAVAIALSAAAPAAAHSGGTDSYGCHHNWADGSGAYHCH